MEEFFTFTCYSGTISISHTTLTGCHAIGGATFLSLLTNGNIDGGDNRGWIWEQVPEFYGYITFF